MPLKKKPRKSARPKKRSIAQKNDFFDFRISPMIRRANKAFRRDLPHLLADPSLDRQWVLYHGDTRVAIRKDQFDAYDEARRRGLPEDEILVQCIAPEPGEIDFERLKYL